MKKSKLLLFLAAVCLVGTSACTLVPPGHVGIVVKNSGSQRGVQDFPVETGRVWYNPIVSDVYQFPTYMQTVSWTKDKNEGKDIDQSITFNSSEGAVINADISVSYALVPEKIPHLFVAFHKDADDLTNTYVRAQVRDEFGRVGSELPTIHIFGEQKGPMLDEIKKRLNDRLGASGFIFDNISFIGALRVDDSVHNSILATIQATQDAIRAQNRVVQVKAEAEQAVAQAKGEADSILMRANAQAEANKTLAKSLTPQLVQYMALEKWNGQLPTVQGGGTTPFFQIK